MYTIEIIWLALWPFLIWLSYKLAVFAIRKFDKK